MLDYLTSCGIMFTEEVSSMRFILKGLSVVVKVAVFIVGIAVLVKLGIKYLEKRGIIKTEWIIKKTSAGRCVKWVMSIKDKVLLSFQL